MHLRGLDLNLLPVLDALLRDRHVTRAAQRVGLSQSAMSHALGRLRTHFDDALLVKTPRGMQPTERAQSLAAPLHAALDQLDRAVAPGATFDPRQPRTFRIGVSDFEAITLVRPLLGRLRSEAPRMDLRLTALLPAYVPDLLARGEVDLVLKPLARSDQAESVYHQRLLEHERFVVVARKGNPHVGKRLTLKRYVDAPHLLIAPGGTPRGVVDELLERRKLTRRIAVSVPHFLVAPHLVAESDLLLTLAERVARRYAPLLDLDVFPLPLPLESFAVHQLWHGRTHTDPAHRFLRKLVREVAEKEQARG